MKATKAETLVVGKHYWDMSDYDNPMGSILEYLGRMPATSECPERDTFKEIKGRFYTEDVDGVIPFGIHEDWYELPEDLTLISRGDFK